MFFIKGDLLITATLRLSHGAPHRIGNPIGIQNRLTAHVAGSSTNGLYQAAF